MNVYVCVFTVFPSARLAHTKTENAQVAFPIGTFKEGVVMGEGDVEPRILHHKGTHSCTAT